MHDTHFVVICIAGFAVFVAAVQVVISHLGGWDSLAERYRSSEPFTGATWSFQPGQFRWLISYNNCLTIGANPNGLFLSIFPLFRIAHPPLLIPWREISVSRKKVLWVRQVQLFLGDELKIPLTVRDRLAHKLQDAAGSSWPVETNSSL